MKMSSSIKICARGGAGMFLPLWQSEHDIHWAVRGFMHLFLICYFFLGINIVSDIFMGSIEKITSKRVQKIEGGQKTTRKLWNDTVATLSLMALGSSAPEISLAVIEIFKKDMHTGELGPSVIVGSAAFNFFVIIAVCVSAIPTGEMRRIENFAAFVTTAIFSAFAYLWLVFILLVKTPDVVEIWEGVATALFLPLLIWVSYSVDVGVIGKALGVNNGPKDREETTPNFARIAFTSEEISTSHSTQERILDIVVSRQGNTSGEVTCTYRTEGLSAVPGYDFDEVEGKICLQDGDEQQHIQVKVLPNCAKWSPRKFCVILDELEGEAEFDPHTDGGEDSDVLTVSVENKAELPNPVQRTVDSVMNPHSFRRAFEDWKEQVLSCVYCNGSAEAQAEAGLADWVYHFFALNWKILFAFIPPEGFCGGWVCFTISIFSIGMLTAVVSDLAELFGCVLGVPDIVTAITIVALGTSMPDLFASQSAAISDPTADAAVVNVTGSNSVNVFLGLGVPWTIAAVYWPVYGRTPEWELRYPEVAARTEGAVFVVMSRDLGFSVVVYCLCSAVATVLLMARRRFIGAVLGGPFWPKFASSLALVTLWCGFVALTSWWVLRGASLASTGEKVWVIGLITALICTVTAWPFVLIHRISVVTTTTVEKASGNADMLGAEKCGKPFDD